jgi:hypothetical protein
MRNCLRNHRHRAEGGGQRAEGQRTEDRGQRAEGRHHAANAAKGKRTAIGSQEVVGAASCREGRKGKKRVSRNDATNATEGKNQGPVSCAGARKIRTSKCRAGITQRRNERSEGRNTRAGVLR